MLGNFAVTIFVFFVAWLTRARVDRTSQIWSDRNLNRFIVRGTCSYLPRPCTTARLSGARSNKSRHAGARPSLRIATFVFHDPRR